MTRTEAFARLSQHRGTFHWTLRTLFSQNPNRFNRFSLQVGDLLFDYSKQRITLDTLSLLLSLAEECRFHWYREALFSGVKLNDSEERPALHTVLRDPTSTPFDLEGVDIKTRVHATLSRLETFADSIRLQKRFGSHGTPFTDILCLGIGGSGLGPAFVTEALSTYKNSALNFHFISNIDGHTLSKTLAQLNPATTFSIVSSKTFTTSETLENAQSIWRWFRKSMPDTHIAQHWAAVTAHRKRAEAFGILPDHIFDFWDWVGGRYSIWSAVGLPVILAIGMPQFKAFLAGAYEMDRHFCNAPLAQNMPVLMALLSIWNRNFWEYPTHAILPYDDALAQFPAYLQQLEMESNGKSINKQGERIDHATAGVIWGDIGCNGQHAFMQLLHQGTQIVPVDFLISVQGDDAFPEHQKLLVANCLSQSKALMEGNIPLNNTNTPSMLSNPKTCLGDRPSSTLMYPRLTPHILGALIAAYEHKVFTQGVIWGINPFDQWGVELGKGLTHQIRAHLDTPMGSDDTPSDSSTLGLIRFFQKTSTST